MFFGCFFFSFFAIFFYVTWMHVPAVNAQWHPPEFMFDGRCILVIIWERKQQVSRPIKYTYKVGSANLMWCKQTFWQSRCLFDTAQWLLSNLGGIEKITPLTRGSNIINKLLRREFIGSLHWTPLNRAVSVKRQKWIIIVYCDCAYFV